MRKPHSCAAAVVRGPSAEGAAARTVTVTAASAGSSRSARKATRRPGSVAFTRRSAASSASTSAAEARRTGTFLPPALTRTDSSIAAGSTRWSKAAIIRTSRREGPPSGWRATRRGGGVENDQREALANAPPPAPRVPAGTSTRYSVAMANRPSGSKTSVRAPTQRHSPGGCGESRAGTACRARPACESSATIGCEKVIERCGASGTSPSGIRLTTSRGPAAAASGLAAASPGGKGARAVRPVRGGGSEPSRMAKGSSRGSAASGGRRSSTRRASASASRSAGGRATSAGASPPSTPSLSRKTSPPSTSVGVAPAAIPARLTSASATPPPPVRACPAARAADTARTDPTSDSLARDIVDLPSPGQDTAEAGFPFHAFAV